MALNVYGVTRHRRSTLSLLCWATPLKAMRLLKQHLCIAHSLSRTKDLQHWLGASRVCAEPMVQTRLWMNVANKACASVAFGFMMEKPVQESVSYVCFCNGVLDHSLQGMWMIGVISQSSIKMPLRKRSSGPDSVGASPAMKDQGQAQQQ